MSNKSKEHRNICRLTVVKIVDSGPIVSNNTDTDEIDIDEEQISTHEPISRHSPQQKRPISPAPTANVVSNKKIKLEQPSNTIKKKPIQSVTKNDNTNKTTVTIKKPKLIPHKSASVVEEKIIKTVPTKELNQTVIVTKHTENPSVSKPRVPTKLVKSQSTNDIKPSIQTTTVNTKKKESNSSPSKIKSTTNSQKSTKKLTNKNLQKPSIKTEQSSNSTVTSPSNIIIKQESTSQPSLIVTSSNNTITSAPINNLKKIPKKPMPPPTVENRSRSSVPSSSLNRNSIRESQSQQPLSSKTKSNIERDRSSSSVNNSNNTQPLEKTNINKNRSNKKLPKSVNSSRHEQTNHSPSSPKKSLLNQKKLQTSSPPKTNTHSPSQFNINPSTNSTLSSLSLSPSTLSNDASQPPIPSPPSNQTFQNEDNHTQAPMDLDVQSNDDDIQLSDTSNSPHEQILIEPTKLISHPIPYSDQSDTNDNHISMDDDHEEDDLPTSLTNDDLRYKLIYIYKRFQLNSINDLVIFVRFFKRHQLIDISSLSMTKTSNEMFTYDLFSLSPSHIIELANDLGYTTTNFLNSIEQ